MTTMGELGTVVGLEEAYDLVEVAAVDGHNARLVREHSKKMTNLQGA